MVLDNLKITSYKGVSSFELAPGKLNVLAGKIGTGKSSVLEAIRFAVTGVSDADTSKADVSVKLLGGKEIHRKASTVKVEDSTTSQDSVRKLLEDGTGVSLDSMKVITSAKLLASMKADKLGEFLITSGLIPMILDYDMVIKLCEVEAPIARELAKHLPKMPEKFGLTKIEEAYQAVYDNRTGLNRDIKTTELRAKFDGEKPMRSVTDVDRALGEIAKGEERQNTYKTLLDNYNKAVAGNENIKKQITDIETKIKSISVTAPDDDERRQLAEQDAAVQREINELQASVQTLRKSIEINQKMLDSLETSVCPLNAKLECKTDKSAIKTDLIAAITEMTALKEKNAGKVEELVKRSAKYQEQIKKIDGQKAAYEELRRLHTTRETLQNSTPPLPEKPTPPDEIKDASAEKAALTQERNRINAYTTALVEKRRLADLKRKHDAVEALLKVLSPKSGIREKIIQSVLEPLEAHCNELAKKLRLDFEVAIHVQKGISFLCKPRASMDFVSLSSVSSGEQALATFLMLDMLNSLSGFRLLMMDDLDKLDAGALDELMAVLTDSEVLERYDHIFLAMVDHDDAIAVLEQRETAIDNLIRF
jgi:DNA repair exonuclease SbcCD ATPase subunit